MTALLLLAGALLVATVAAARLVALDRPAVALVATAAGIHLGLLAVLVLPVVGIRVHQ